jgi:thiamine transport system substrate-binding protein
MPWAVAWNPRPCGRFFKAEFTMQRRFLFSALVSASLVCAGMAPALAQAVTPLRVLTHGSFDLPKPLLAQFEKDAGVKLQIIKAGDAGEMVNKLILTRAQPIADVVFGIDNTLALRAQSAGVLDAYTGPATQRAAAQGLPENLVPVDYGFVNLNIDKAWFAQKKLALPTSLADLTQPAYAKLLVVQNPATSSPGQAFLLATIAGLGEEGAFAWWQQMRANGVKVVKGWSEAYYTEFSRNGGAYPIVVSYTSSPAAEVFYSKEKITEPPTANLFLKGGVFRQVEGVALVKGGDPAAKEAAGRFIEFLRSASVQEGLQTTMWVFPAEAGAPRVDVMKQHAVEPSTFDELKAPLTEAQSKAWLQRWTKTVLK